MKNLANAMTFIAVAEEQSFAAAAGRLGMSSAAVSKAIARLEQQLQVKLIHRTTRSMALTPEGEQYLSGMRQIALDLDVLNQEVSAGSGIAKGRLKVSVPPAWGRVVMMPRMAAFRARFPEIILDISFDSHEVNLAADNVDVVIRSNKLPDSANLVARKFAQVHRVVCATPEFLDQIQTGSELKQLQPEACIVVRHNSTGKLRPWRYSDLEGQTKEFVIQGHCIVDDEEAAAIAVKASQGIGQLFDFFVAEHLQQGTLLELFGEARPEPIPLYIMYLDRKLVSPRIRAFIDFFTGS